MKQRINLIDLNKDALRGMYNLEAYLAGCGLETSLLHLIKFRVSQINGCAYCLDMHSKDLRAAGETEQRLYLLNAWRESPLYTDRERAATMLIGAINAWNRIAISFRAIHPVKAKAAVA